MVGTIVILFVVFMCSGFKAPLKPLLCFIIVLVVLCFPLRCITYEGEGQTVDRTDVCNLELL